jgi:hypothetical protein
LIELVSYGADGKLTMKNLYKYDAKGNQIEVDCYDADGMFKNKVLYKYDDKGNNIEQVNYWIKGVYGDVKEIPTEQTIWEYEFYPEESK